jgi:hypothetical protein
MCSIILIGTGHWDLGLYNSDELLKIIERIAPEIIFEETNRRQHDPVYAGVREDTLETYTIKRYLQIHPIDHLPVDLDTDPSIEGPIANGYTQLSNFFKSKSPEYDQLSNQILQLASKFGLPFMNSDQCRAIREQIMFLERTFLKRLNNQQFYKVYNNWLDLNDRREMEMIKNIYNNIDGYNNALFLVGAEHRQPLINKISKFEPKHEMKLNWIFDYFE